MKRAQGLLRGQLPNYGAPRDFIIVSLPRRDLPSENFLTFLESDRKAVAFISSLHVHSF